MIANAIKKKLFHTVPKNISVILCWGLLVCVTPGLTGCGGLLGLKGADTPIQTFVFDTPAPESRSKSSGNHRLIRLLIPSSNAVFDTKQMPYMERDHELKYFARSAWVARPTEMLLPLMLRDLEAIGEFEISTKMVGVEADFHLHTLILNVYQDFRKKPSVARVAIKVALVESATRKLLGARTFVEIEAAPSEDSYGGVKAVNQALARILKQVVEFVLVSIEQWS